MATRARSLLAAGLLASGMGSLLLTNAAPLSWVVASLSVWSSFLLASPKDSVQQSWMHVAWAYGSAVAFLFYLHKDPSFQSWSHVYYFCSSQRFCTCDFRWTWLGYLKFLALWNFILSAALGVQKLIVDFCLDGLLPGEEVVTKESFVSICWRLIPYWLNSWEQEWGAECSSALFELPHFAVELLIVLPTVQIICSRLRILALPQLRVVVPVEAADQDEIPREDLAPDIMRGHWRIDRRQRSLLARLSANKRVMLVMVGVALLAAANAILVPISMEAAVRAHPRSRLLQAMPEGEGPLPQSLAAVQAAYHARGCTRTQPISNVMQKHALELRKMGDQEHMRLVPLIEAALAIMRLSCEKFFVLASVFAAYLLFREPPRMVRYVIQLNARLSDAFQKVVLYTFPAICWAYGAGFTFSAFVSVIFWGGPALRLLETVRMHSATVRPAALTPASEEDVERMDGNCAICWSSMTVGRPPEADPDTVSRRRGMTLPCKHAYHEACIVQWLRQCHGQGRVASCPMCAKAVELRIQWRLPFQPAAADQLQLPPDEGEDGDDGAPLVPPGGGAPVANNLFPELQAIIEEHFLDDPQVPLPAPAQPALHQHVVAPLPPPLPARPPTPVQLAHSAAHAQLEQPTGSGLPCQHAEPAATADSASSVQQPAPHGDGAGPSGRQQLPHRRPAAWQQQLASGISFGSARQQAAAGTAGGAGSDMARSASPGAAAAAAPASGEPSGMLTRQAQLQELSLGGRAMPFAGRGYRLGGGSSNGGGAAGSDGGDEATSGRRRSQRQHLPTRWAGQSSSSARSAGADQ